LTEKRASRPDRLQHRRHRSFNIRRRAHQRTEGADLLLLQDSGAHGANAIGIKQLTGRTAKDGFDLYQAQ